MPKETFMSLDREQLLMYEKDGFIILNNLISKDHIQILMSEAKLICETDAPERVIERNGQANSVYITERYTNLYTAPCLPQLLEPAKQILDSDVYVHQSKVNPKVALHGSVVEWHRDFSYWNELDGMPQPRAVTAVLFLQDVDEFNSPLLLIPKSHQVCTEQHNSTSITEEYSVNVAPSGQSWKNATLSEQSTVVGDLKFTEEKAHIKEPIFAAKALAGSVLFFHPNLIHGSTHNLSPRDRYLIFITYNSTQNSLTDVNNPRPYFIANRQFKPIKALAKRHLF
jgi:ectoine hydroxylase